MVRGEQLARGRDALDAWVWIGVGHWGGVGLSHLSHRSRPCDPCVCACTTNTTQVKGRDAVERHYQFKDFSEAWAFMSRAALVAEKVCTCT